jgi:hypothetical protein
METTYETFDFCGQMRYRCNKWWPNGTQCEYDTYDLALMDAHVREVHAVKKSPVPPMPTLFDAEGKQVTREDPVEEEEVQFAPGPADLDAY